MAEPGPAISEAEMLPCDQCERKFATAQGLSMHKTRAHGKKKWSGSRSNGPTPVPVLPAPPPEEPEEVKPDGSAAAIEQQRVVFIEELLNLEESFYLEAVRAFLPLLAEEIRLRTPKDAELMDAFFVLYTDANAIA